MRVFEAVVDSWKKFCWKILEYTGRLWRERNAINGNVARYELEDNSNRVVVLPRSIDIVRKHAM